MKVPCFVCERARYDAGSGCFRGKLKEPEAEEVVLKCINQRLEQQRDEEKCRGRELQEQGGGSFEQSNVQNKSALLEKKLEILKVEKQYLYEQFKMKQLGKDEYLCKVEELRTEEQRMGEEIRKMKEERIKEEQRKGESGDQELGKMRLSRELVSEIVEMIYVCGKGEFETVWKE